MFLLLLSSKVKYLWDFAVNGNRHTIILEHSMLTTKRRVIVDGYLKYEKEE